ncbi:MAG: glycosyltransferase [Planctomycetota bacterium]|nr:glycosyltransferase [Planctomycetota bacterium]
MISVVIPVYNERDNIATCLRGLAAALAGEPHELLVVYDFDADTTLEGIRAMPDVPATLQLVRNRIGKGAANAIRAGFEAARGDVVVTTMADLSDPPERILDLARKMRESGVAVVAGSRYMPGGSQEGGPLVKRTLSRVAGLSLHWVAGVATHDATNNFKAYSKRFLESVKVEAQGAFDIGLELTVKAHLAEAGVAEVPTSWRDRSAGESRFKVWAWAPRYLKWYAMAMVEPALVWLVWAGFVAWLLSSASWREPGSAGDLGLSLLHAWLAGAVIVVAREIRGRMRWWDAALALPWANPRHSAAWNLGNGELAVALALTSTTLMYVFGCGPRKCFGALRRSFRALASGDGLRVAVGLVLGTLLWLRGLSIADPTVDIALDPSWVAAYPRFALEGLQAGVDYVYTYGPLSHFPIGDFEPALAWNRLVLWEGLFELAACLLIAVALVRVGDWLEGVWIAALLVATGSTFDEFGSLLCLGAAAIGIRNVHSGWTRALALAVLAVVGFTKFTLLPQAWLAAAAICATPLLSRSWWSGAVRALFFAVAVVAAWLAAGQRLTTFPKFLVSSLEVSTAYAAAMSRAEGSSGFAWLGFGALALAALVCALRIRGAREKREPAMQALVLMAVLAAAYRSNSVRHEHAGSFVLVALVGAFFLPGARAGEARAWVAGRAVRLALVAFVLLVPREEAASVFERAPATLTHWRAGITLLQDAASVEARALEEREHQRARFRLERLGARIGQASVDVLGDEQALAILNGLHWTPRPAFQSYGAQSVELQRRNGEFLRGPSAPEFVLQRLGAIDNRYAACTDTEALLEVLGNYVPVDVERGFLLWQRKPAEQRRELAITPAGERELVFGEWIELDGEGDLLASLDVRRTARGEARALVAASAPFWLEVRDSRERLWRFRLFPALVESPFPLRPLLVGQEEVVGWALGEPLHARALRIVADEAYPDDYEPKAQLTLQNVDGLPRRAWSGADEALRWSMLTTVPSAISEPFFSRRERLGEREVLLVAPTSELRFTLEPGRYRLRALAVAPAWSWKPDQPNDGFVVEVLVTGRPEPLWSHEFDPLNVVDDRSPQVVREAFRLRERGDVVVRVLPRAGATGHSSPVMLTGFEFDPLER